MKFCPHCGGDIAAYLAAEGGLIRPGLTTTVTVGTTPAAKYDKTKIWKDLVALARGRNGKDPPALLELVEPAVGEFLSSADPTVNVEGLRTVVHIVFDRQIVPQGGLLHQAMIADGRNQSAPARLE